MHIENINGSEGVQRHFRNFTYCSGHFSMKKNHESSSMKLSMVVVVADSDLVAGITGFSKYRS